MSSKSGQKVYNEICDTLQIVKHILSKTETAAPEFETNRYAKTICYYTGVDRKSVDELLKNGKARKTFFDLLETKNNKLETSVISFERMRNIIIDQYVMNQQIPTKASIVKASRTYVKGYNLSILKQDLYNLGFIWKRLPKSDKCIVVENTEQFSNRMKYFHQMQEYRDSNRVLIHVERTPPCFYYVTERRAQPTEIIAIASPQLGLIDTYFPPKLKTLEFFLRNKLHTIPDNSVFVIEQSNRSGVDFERTCLNKPTIHSQKKEMVEWLKAYNIPCDSTLHRGELFALIEKHKVNCPSLYRCCEFLKAAGHDVILRPPELTYIKYFKEILKRIDVENNMTLPAFKTYVLHKFNFVHPEFWLHVDKKMAETEQKIYNEDQKLELILDKLMEGISNKSLSVSDFKECENEGFDNEFVDNIIAGAYPNALGPGSFQPFKRLAFKPGPSGSSKPGPSGSSKPGPSGSSKPRPSGSSKPKPSGISKPGPSGSSKPGPSESCQPGPSESSKPGPSHAQPGPSHAEPGPY